MGKAMQKPVGKTIRRKLLFPKLYKAPTTLVHQRGYRIEMTGLAKYKDCLKHNYRFAFARVLYQNAEIGVVCLNLVKNSEFKALTLEQTNELYICAYQVILRHRKYCQTRVDIGVCKIDAIPEAPAPVYTPYPHVQDTFAPFVLGYSPVSASFLFAYDSINFALVLFYTRVNATIKVVAPVALPKPRRARMLNGLDERNIIGSMGKRTLRCRRNMM